MHTVTNHRIINGDSREMPEIENNSVNLVITSPPYWQLKDYENENQIGYNDTYETYINNLNLIWEECFRVLDNGCRLCVNIGDQFARSVYYGRYKVIPIRTEIIKFCESIGFDYMGAVIWQKKTTTNTTGGASIMGSFPFPRNGIFSIDYEFILIFKKLGKPTKPDPEKKKLSKLTTEEWKEYFSGHWNFGGAKQDGHIAMFPEELPKRLIKMFSFVGDVILDPFAGSGTTSLAAKNLDRNSVGYEINADFIPFIKAKLNSDYDDAVYDFTKQKSIKTDFKKRIENFPYVFKDPHALDKNIDPKKLQFGSKIDKNSKKREEYFSVKQIISPELLLLNNGSKVRLLGIKENKKLNGAAVEFLSKKLKGQKVFLKHDVQKYDDEENLLGYLYLKNKTFINAHLIKNGLAQVDTSIEYKNKSKFLGLEKNNK
ncbi:MAG: site-specific DNA-methyltransferase [Calditrichaeota bacterium]|nr:MAG: site-specific DNA-methyltransferase [Calditrichota bacterium]MBL1205336.1 site-specific DNA-methyltransferase [Calditrichota bacterium]NOG45165.1 site-specific DNA-methyltransferase [Calditrichota bacterium]